MEQQQGMEQVQDTARPRVGAILREARERMGMSVEEVAIRLKFAPRQIIALEEDNFAQLPEMAFVRGFVRSYARLMQIDETALLEALPGAPAREQAQARRMHEDVLPGDAGTRNQNLIWLAAALVVAVVIVILAWKYDAGNAVPKPASNAKPEATSQASSPAVATAQPAGDTAVNVAQQAQPEPQQPAKASTSTAATKPAVTATATKPAHPTAHAASAVHAAVPRAHAASAVEAASGVYAASGVTAAPRKTRTVQPLRLEFDEDSWVEVQDSNGKVLLSTLGKQGTSKIVSGATPISVTIGNAKGVRVYYKNKQRELGAVTDQNTAHLRLE
jgi:cytoskeleton protein RodZ